MEDNFISVGKWSVDVMPDAPPESHLLKLKHEAEEAIQEPNNISEYADCFLCIFAAAYKSGFSFSELENACRDKIEILKDRKWKKLEDGTYQHF